MNENTIFSNSQNKQEQSANLTPVQVDVKPAMPQSIAQPPYTPPPSIPSRFGLLMKAVIAIVLLICLFFLVMYVILPFFSKVSKPQTVTITYWGLWEPKNVMQPIIDAFEKEHPNIKVVYDLRDIKRYRETLVTRIAGGDGPDVYRFHNSWTKQIQSSLTPLPKEVITAESMKKDYYPVVRSDMVQQGAIYGVPIQIDTLSMFVNDDILSSAGVSVPTTWEDFTKVTSAITVRDADGIMQTAGASLGSYDTITRAPDIISLLFVQNKVNMKDPAKTTQNVSEALRFYTDFTTGHDNIEKIWDNQKEPALDAFAGGTVGMFFGYSWDIFAIKAKNPILSFSIHPVPALTNPVTIASYWAEGVSSKTKHQKEALLFLTFLTKKETEQQLFTIESKTRLFGELPARRDLGQLVSKNPLLDPFLKQAEYAVSSYYVSDTFDNGLNDQLNVYLGNAVRAILGNTSVESATDTFVKGATQVLKRYGIN